MLQFGYEESLYGLPKGLRDLLAKKWILVTGLHTGWLLFLDRELDLPLFTVIVDVARDFWQLVGAFQTRYLFAFPIPERTFPLEQR
jgi:hypothetical protein